MRTVHRCFSLLLSSLLVVTTVASCDSDPERVTRTQCAELRDHMVELRLASVTADVDQHRASIRAALGEDFLASCLERTSDADLRCGLAARDSESLVTCFQP